MIKYFNKWGWISDKERSTWNKRLLKEWRYKDILSRYFFVVSLPYILEKLYLYISYPLKAML